ncbi:unnamed protein product [Effrenium voratum]|nr:unnamed protein product [Effrenium voratum]
METYWTQGSFDAVVGRLQLGLQKPCGELGARGDFCQLRLRQTSYFDALVENLADLWKEQAHFVQGSSKAHKQIESLLKVELGDGAMQRICQDKHVCQALRRAAEKPEENICSEGDLCFLCTLWIAKTDGNETSCVPKTSVPAHNFIVQGSKYMTRAWQMVEWSRVRAESGTMAVEASNVPKSDSDGIFRPSFRASFYKDQVQEMLEYSARCLTSYAAEMQADWRGSGHQVPLEVFREFQICLGRSALNVEDWHWNLEQLSAWWIMFLLRSEPSLNGSSQLAG